MSTRSLLLAATFALLVTGACDPVTGTGAGTPPDPRQYLKVDSTTQTAVVTLIAGYPATDYQFNYDGYGNGTLMLKVPVGWQVTVQCANHSTVPNSRAVVSARLEHAGSAAGPGSRPVRKLRLQSDGSGRVPDRLARPRERGKRNVARPGGRPGRQADAHREPVTW